MRTDATIQRGAFGPAPRHGRPRGRPGPGPPPTAGDGPDRIPDQPAIIVRIQDDEARTGSSRAAARTRGSRSFRKGRSSRPVGPPIAIGAPARLPDQGVTPGRPATAADWTIFEPSRPLRRAPLVSQNPGRAEGVHHAYRNSAGRAPHQRPERVRPRRDGDRVRRPEWQTGTSSRIPAAPWSA